MKTSGVIEGVIGIAVVALVAIYMYVYALAPVIGDSSIFNGTGAVLMANLFVIMFFLAISLLPISILYKAIKG